MPKNLKPDPLLARLANLKPRAEPSGRAEEPPPPAAAPGRDGPPAAGDRLAPTFSVSIFESDFDRLETVRRWLTSRGARSANKSELLRLGLRFAAGSEENAARLAEIYREMKAQDGRKRPLR